MHSSLSLISGCMYNSTLVTWRTYSAATVSDLVCVRIPQHTHTYMHSSLSLVPGCMYNSTLVTWRTYSAATVSDLCVWESHTYAHAGTVTLKDKLTNTYARTILLEGRKKHPLLQQNRSSCGRPMYLHCVVRPTRTLEQLPGLIPVCWHVLGIASSWLCLVFPWSPEGQWEFSPYKICFCNSAYSFAASK